MRPVLIAVTGPIAAGKSTVAGLVADRMAAVGRRAVLCDLDDVVFAARSTAQWDPWPAARRLHGELVAGWFRAGADVVVAVAPLFTPADHAALRRAVPDAVDRFEVLVEAPLEVTWQRATADPGRRQSREREFHVAAHRRYLEVRDTIPADLVVDSSTRSVESIAATVCRAVTGSG